MVIAQPIRSTGEIVNPTGGRVSAFFVGLTFSKGGSRTRECLEKATAVFGKKGVPDPNRAFEANMSQSGD